MARESVSVVEWLEHLLHPWTSFVIVPLFALANAGMPSSTTRCRDAASSPITHRRASLGLVVGKLVGITAVHLAGRPARHRRAARRARRGAAIVGVAALAGIGFTVSIFVTGLAFDDAGLQDEAKIGILAASDRSPARARCDHPVARSAGPMTTEAVERAETERWFIRRGLPHFIDGYSAGTDIWTRSLPCSASPTSPAASTPSISTMERPRNLLAAAVILAVLIAGIAIANCCEGSRPLDPADVGPGELALFVIGPSLPALFLGQPGDALQSALTGVGVLLVIYIVTSYGLIPMTKWAFGQLGEQIADLGHLVVKALPLLLLFITFLFVNTEVWQVAGNLDGPAYWLVLALFFVIGASSYCPACPSRSPRSTTSTTGTRPPPWPADAARR